jgi:hypothetical protein
MWFETFRTVKFPARMTYPYRFCVVWAIRTRHEDAEYTQELYFMWEAVRMILGSNLCLSGDLWWCSTWSWVRIFVFLVNGGVVHGRGVETLGGQWCV